MAQNKTHDQINLILNTAMKLADTMGWENVTLSQIALHSELPETQIKSLVHNKSRIAQMLMADIDQQLIKNCADSFSTEDNAKDRLFDVMMERFEILNENKSAITSIYKSMLRGVLPTPETLLCFRGSMITMLEVAQILPHTKLPTNEIHIKGLALIYLATVRTWMTDDTDDLSVTMATLDKYLSQADRVLKKLPLVA